MKIDFIIDDGSSKEDSYLVGNNIYGVFDGFNSLEGFLGKSGKTGGKIAATIARDEFYKNDRPLEDLAIEANRKIRERVLSYKIDMSKKSKLWGTLFAVGRISGDSFEWAQMGDPMILAVYRDKSFKPLVKDYDHDKEVLKIWKRLADQKKENLGELVKVPVLEVRKGVNENYGALTGEEKAISFLKTGREPLKGLRDIIIFTDGLFIPKENPEADDDWAKFVELYMEGGIKNVKGYVRKLENEDPKCWVYPRFKQYDDIAVISISL